MYIRTGTYVKSRSESVSDRVEIEIAAALCSTGLGSCIYLSAQSSPVPT